MDRYATGAEDEFQPGSEGRVLKNHLGIVDPGEVGHVEAALLANVYLWIRRSISPNLILSSHIVRGLHREWLRTLYPFSGELRRVNVSKDAFLFAPAPYLTRGLAELDSTLRRHMPCSGLELDDLAQAIAIVHAELLLLHPFREGNGRIGRLVADIMATQAGEGLLNWRFDEPDRRERYFAAMRRGFLKDYAPLTDLVWEALSEPEPEAPPP